MSGTIPPFTKIDAKFQEQEELGIGPYDWLEDTRDSSKRVDAWIRKQNERATSTILKGVDVADTELYKERLDLLTRKDKIPYIGHEEAGYVYNFWQDEKNTRGLWRRTTLAEYGQENTKWEQLFDVDAYNAKEGSNYAGDSAWCWQAPLGPDYKSALLTLSPGGNDKTHLFEFDFATKRFKTPMDQGGDGFSIRDAAKMRIVAYDQDTLYVSTPLPEHDEWGGVTESTYARVLKLWRRGVQRDYKSAETVLEIPRCFMWIDPEVDVWKYANGAETRRVLIDCRPSFYKHRIVLHDPSANELTRLALPDEIDTPYMSYFDYYLVTLRDARWGFPADSLLVCYLDDLLEAAYLEGELVMSDEDAQRIFFPLFTPTPSTTLCSAVPLRSFLVLVVMEDVKSKLVIWDAASQVKREGVPISQAFRPSALRTPWSDSNCDVVSAFSRHADGTSDELLVQSHGFLKPATVEILNLGAATSSPADPPVSAAQPLTATTLKATPDRFDTRGMSVQQHFATSLDGTRVPFFVVGKDLDRREPRPLLLYGYGAHGAVVEPGYNSWTVGNLWLSRGGLFASANIRGGGEYGFRWHEAAAPNRLKAYEDFEAVASCLIRDLQLTAPERLACMGGSMGGLLTANMLTRDNGLFRAVVSECPLADMERFRFLGMGHSWIPELGDPSTPEGWQAVSQYSPLHRISPPGERRFAYPASLFVSSSNDDRTHPAHGRKMVAKMAQVVGEATADAWLLEECEGGHGGNADIEQMARHHAIVFYFLWRSLAPEAGVPLKLDAAAAPEEQPKRRRVQQR